MSDVELSAPIQPDAMTELRNAFAEFDKDSDGHITKEELAGVMGNFGHIISPQDLDNVIKLVDTDGNGVVDFKVTLFSDVRCITFNLTSDFLAFNLTSDFLAFNLTSDVLHSI